MDSRNQFLISNTASIFAKDSKKYFLVVLGFAHRAFLEMRKERTPLDFFWISPTSLENQLIYRHAIGNILKLYKASKFQVCTHSNKYYVHN